MVRRALDGQPITMWHDGTVAHDVTYIEDVARAFLAAMDHPDGLTGRHWLIGAGRHDRLGDVFRTVADVVADLTGQAPVPVVSVTPPAEAPATDFLSVYIDPAPFGTATGWSAQVPVRDGIETTVRAILDGTAPTRIEATASVPNH